MLLSHQLTQPNNCQPTAKMGMKECNDIISRSPKSPIEKSPEEKKSNCTMECNDIISKSSKGPIEKSPQEKNSNCTISLLEGEEIFFNRLLSRDPCMGFSSRVYCRAATGRVPFEWETQPGKPKIVLESVPLPPISPPPGLPGSCRRRRQSRSSKRWRVLFWKNREKGSQQSQSQSQRQGVEMVESFGFWSCEGDDDSASLPRNSHSSSSGGSMNSPAMVSRMTVKSCGEMRGMSGLDWAWSCTPWRF